MHWVKAILCDSAVVGLLVAGYELPNEMALNVALFIGWFFAITALLGSFVWDEASKKEDRNSPKWQRKTGKAWRAYDVATDVIAVVVFAAYGHFVLAAVMAVGKLFLKVSIYNWLNDEEAAA